MRSKQTEKRQFSPEEMRRVREIAALLYFRRVAAELKVPPDPMKGRRPKITRMMSREQRIVFGQTANTIRAIYGTESKWNETPLLRDDATTTREVGPNDRYNARQNYRTGKATGEPTVSNKRAYRGRRAYGGGTNKQRLADLISEYDN
jgi:hypothetical protein